MKKKSFTCIEESLIDLYVSTKDKIYNHSQKSDLDYLKKLNPILIVDYISSLINILFDRLDCQNSLNLDVCSEQQPKIENDCNSVYEKLLQEHESTIRQHIKLEYQLKLQNEAYVTKIDELERKISTYKDLKSDQSGRIESNIISGLNKEIITLKKQVEILIGKQCERDKLIKQLKVKNESEIASIEAKYKEKLEQQQKRIETLESSVYTQKSTNDLTVSTTTKSNISLTKTPSYRVSNVTGSSKQMKNICLYIHSNEITQENIINCEKGSIDTSQCLEIVHGSETLDVSLSLIY